MAGNVTTVKLGIDSTEYTNKLKRATDQLLKMEADCQKVASTMSVAEKEDIAFARSLGNMATMAKTARGKMAELNNAFTEASLVYKRLTDEEKQSPFGKELAKSVETLKGRLREAKADLQGVTDATKGGGSALEGLADKLGLSVGQLTKLGGAAAVASTALKVAKDAFLSNEACVDEWGRTVTSSEEVYKSFVSSLNNASFSGFLTNIQNVIKSARDAYDALDNLATKGGVISNKEAKLNYQRDKQAAIINDKSKSAAERQAAQQRLKEIDKEMRAAKVATAQLNNDVVKSKITQLLVNNQFTEGSKAFKTAYDKIVASLYDENMKMGVVNTGKQGGMRINNGKTVRYTDNGGRNLDRIVTDEFRNEINGYVQAVWNSLSEAERNTKLANRFAQKGLTSGGSTTTTDKLAEAIAKAQGGFNRVMSAEEVSKLRIEPELVGGDSKILKELTKNGENPLAAISAAIGYGGGDGKKTFSKMDFERSKFLKNQNKMDDKKESDFKKQVTKSLDDAGQIVGSISNINGALQNMGIDLGEGFTKAINIMQSILTVATSINAIVTVIQALTAVDTVTPMANGGIVPQYAAGGRLFQPRGVDTIPAMLSPGELVLNRAQQGNLSSQLSGGNLLQNLSLETAIREDKLVVMLNNGLRKRGKGTLMTSRR